MQMILKSKDGIRVRFRLYEKEAPLTCKALLKAFPLSVKFVQGRYAGEEIYSPKGPNIKLPAENATINLKVGEIGYAPPSPRNEVSKCFGIVYGDAKLSDWVNVFGIVVEKDLPLLKKIGEKLWLEGSQELVFEKRSKARTRSR